MAEYYSTDKHVCKFFAYTSKADFEPVFIDGEVLYRRNEYLISGCSCGKAPKELARNVPEDV